MGIVLVVEVALPSTVICVRFLQYDLNQLMTDKYVPIENDEN